MPLQVDRVSLFATSLALATAAVAVAPSCMADAPPITELDPIGVQGTGLDPAAAVRASQLELKSVPGGASLVTSSQYREAAVIGVRDALSRTPGVYVQNPSGQVSAKVSIRGSGISASSGLRGIRLLRDGLPLGRSDDLGDSIYADPFGASHIEIYRGASSLRYGAATLGGAINLISPTGYSNPGIELRAEGGSDHYRQSQLRAGGVFDNGLDTFVSATGFRADGFREHSRQKTDRFYGNIGYRFSPTSKGRLHLTFEEYKIEMPGALTLDQLQDDPRAANPTNIHTQSRIHTSPRWHLAYQHDWQLGVADKLSLGMFHTGTRFDSSTLLRVRYKATDYGIALRHELDRHLGDKAYELVWGANYSGGSSHNRTYTPDHWPGASAQLESIDGTRSTFELFAESTLKVRSDLAVVAGVQAIWAKRHTDNKALTPLGSLSYPGGRASADYSGFNPKLGVVWDVSANSQVFANISRSFEAPNSVAFHTPTGSLKAQRAATIEVGARGGDSGFGWDLALYNSWIRNELLESLVAGNPALPPLAHNADSTRHLGMELGLHGQAQLGPVPGYLAWNLAYTWNRFQFQNDDLYGNNMLPSIPEHLARLDLIYRHPSGYYGGPNFEFASGWYVDQANTLKAPGYGIINFTIGYEAPGGRYRVFIDARNLADKYYATSTNYIVDARVQPSDVFYPGQTRAVFAGLQLNW